MDGSFWTGGREDGGRGGGAGAPAGSRSRRRGATGRGCGAGEAPGPLASPHLPGADPAHGGRARRTLALAGVSLDVRALRAPPPRGRFETRGGFLFTHRGYSGPSVLDVSHFAVRSRLEGREPQPILVQWTERDAAGWERELLESERAPPSAPSSGGPSRSRLAEPAVRGGGGRGPQWPLSQLRREERLRLVELLARYPLPWTGDEGYEKAEVTGGGIPLGGGRLPSTLESRRPARALPVRGDPRRLRPDRRVQLRLGVGHRPRRRAGRRRLLDPNLRPDAEDPSHPLLEGFPVVVETPIAWGDMDYFRHVNNIVFFRYFESARIAYLERIRFEDEVSGGDRPDPALDAGALPPPRHLPRPGDGRRAHGVGACSRPPGDGVPRGEREAGRGRGGGRGHRRRLRLPPAAARPAPRRRVREAVRRLEGPREHEQQQEQEQEQRSSSPG